MLSKFFRRRAREQQGLYSDDAEQRRQALAALAEPDPAQQQRIDELASGDPDPDVRNAAVSRVMDSALLQRLLDDEPVADTAAKRLLTLSPDIRVDHPRITNARLAGGVPADETSIAQLTADAFVEALITSRGDARDALLAAPRLNQQAVLTILEKQSRNRDKSLNRLARDRLDTARSHAASFSTLKQRAEELIAALEKHLGSDPAAAGYSDKHQQLRQRLDQTMADLAAVTRQLDAAAMATEGVDVLNARISSLPALQTADTAVNDSAPFVALSAEFVELERALKSAINVTETLSRHAALTERWLSAAVDNTPDDAAHALFTRVNALAAELAAAGRTLAELPAVPEQPLSTSLPDSADDADTFWPEVERRRRWLRDARSALQRVRWPDWAAPAESVALLREAINRDSATLETLETATNAALTRLSDTLTELQTQIDAGESRAAAQLRGRARDMLQTLPKQRVREANRTLNQLAAQLGELKDWQTYATTPKRQALCAQMTSLAEAPREAAEQANQIKDLRRQWNELGNPGSRADRDLAAEFNAAAERAFEPCRAFYAQQAALREDNRRAREAICEQLEAYLESTDFASTDIKAAEQIMRTARSEWQRFQPVERKHSKRLEQRFEALQNTLHGQIKGQWDTNLAAKTAIVDAARALLEDAVPVNEAVDGAKRLQQQWRQVGPTPRRPDQQLWQTFRGICDQIFAARDDARSEADRAVQQAQAQADALLERFQASLDEQFDGAALREFESQFTDLPDLPERIARGVQQRFQKLHDQAETHLQQQADIRRLAQLRAELDEDARRDPGDGYASLADLQRLVIEAEIAAGIESADADRELRMQIQVELMNAGKSQQALAAQPKDLVAAWLALPAKEPAHDHLRQRFDTAISQLISA